MNKTSQGQPGRLKMVHTFQPPEAAAHTSPYGGVAPFCVYDWGSEKYSSGAVDLPTELLNCLFL